MQRRRAVPLLSVVLGLGSCSTAGERPADAAVPPSRTLDASFGNAGIDGAPASLDAGACGVARPCQLDGGCIAVAVQPQIERKFAHSNLLVIFDRSVSVRARWHGEFMYELFGNALIEAIRPVQDWLTVGAILFPDETPDAARCPCTGPDARSSCCLPHLAGCEVSGIDEEGQISFRDAASFIEELPRHWLHQGYGLSPLFLATRRATEALDEADLEGPTTVIILTDANPGCARHDDPPIEDIVAEVASWAARGVRTYVVTLARHTDYTYKVANSIASAGDTGNAIAVVEGDEVRRQVKAALTHIVTAGFESCALKLDPRVEAPEALHVFVTERRVEREVPREGPLDADAGASVNWRTSAGGTDLVLEGELCREAQSGRVEELRAEIGCEGERPVD